MEELLSFPATAEQPHDLPMPQLETKLVQPAEFFFTYGSLMRGQMRHHVLEHEAFEGEAYLTDAQVFDTGYGFPALFVGSKYPGNVWGECYRIVHPAIWTALDRIENGLYFRVARRIHIPGKPPMLRMPLAQMYIGNPDIFDSKSLKLIPEGRWTNAITGV